MRSPSDHARLPTGLTALLLLCAAGCSGSPAGEPEPTLDAGRLGVDAAHGDAGRDQLPPAAFVAAYNALAREAAASVLEEGGSAADAFIAATLVEYVIASSGVTTLAGPLGVMVYDPAEGEVLSLEANMTAPSSAEGLYDPSAPTRGDTAMVPGAPRALEALSLRYGKLPWARLVAPAQRVAAEGFEVDAAYAYGIEASRTILERSAYGRRTFFDEAGEPLGVGAVLRQPELARFLGRFAEEGAAAFYEGPFAAEYAQVVAEAGGAVTRADLAAYEVRFEEPWMVPYRDAQVYGQSGRAYGGPWVLLGLAALERGGVSFEDAAEVDRLELLLRTARSVHQEAWFFDAATLDDPAQVGRRLASPDAVWARVEAGAPETASRSRGSHSFHVTARDHDGLVVTGTHTIHSYGWGEGLFVEGVVLSAAGTHTHLIGGPGERMLSALANHVALRDGSLVFAGGTFGSALLEAQLQLVVAAVDEGLSATEAGSRPRFGTFPFDGTTVDVDRNWISTEVSPRVVSALESRGLLLTADPYGDLGFGTFVIARGGEVTGGTLSGWIEGDVRYVESR